jgi:2-C-methyl-D-erythritol 4-phosphate cytidylyltransferase
VKNGIILETVDRDELAEIQTPQVFNTDIIKGALTKAIKNSAALTDDCMAVELLGVKIYLVPGSVKNMKLTNRDDIPLIKAILPGENS